MNFEPLMLKMGRAYEKVPVLNILYIICVSRLRKVVTIDNKVYLINTSLEELRSKLPDAEFMKIHKSSLICLRHVSSLNSETVIIAGRPLKVSRSYKAELHRRFNKLR
ncbi:LytTR family DNA-binding domain-containing protein [Flavihumibacter solisilvae]|uniref:HTH LytTR-type domain-containing protein n=1 Tax=Flavihumibacter solisilvae TaxID=1349421 RepID=A0A0C1LH57_9BACT|nr:LytTR family DNA-binding domain-containing protein [Flavihumibacter solisilvae]KIC94643.1 hypothetical protein OI18_11190 [Flavihumibacter solisilvae]